MPHDIGQSFLYDSKQRGRSLRRQIELVRVGVECSTNSSPLLKLRNLPFNGRSQSEFVQNGGPQLRNDLANALDRMIHVDDHGFDLLVRAVCSAPVLSL